MDTPNTVRDANDTRKQFKVLKDWDVTDTTLPYYGKHEAGEIVLVHEDVAAPLVEDGTLEAVPEGEGPEKAQEPAEEVAAEETQQEEI